VLLVLVVLAFGLCGARFIDPTAAAILILALLVVTRTITWNDVLADWPAWNTFRWARSARPPMIRPAPKTPK
jgi:L-tartrate/succinate antiporter